MHRRRTNPPPHPQPRQRVLDHEQRRLGQTRFGQPSRGTGVIVAFGIQHGPQVDAQWIGEPLAARIHIGAELGLVAIEPAGHADVLRSLSAEQEHRRSLAGLDHGAHRGTRIRLPQRLHGLGRVTAHNDPAVREPAAADTQRVRHIGQRRFGMLVEERGQPLFGGVERPGAPGRQRQQLPLTRRRGCGWCRGLLEHGVRIGPADPERADAGAARRPVTRPTGGAAR